MTHSLLLAAGLGLALGSGALAQDRPVPADELAQTEIAPGASVQPLGTPTSRQPLFVLMQDDAAPSMAEADVLPGIGTSGLLAFGPEGIRLPRYEPEIVTGSVMPVPTPLPRR